MRLSILLPLFALGCAPHPQKPEFRSGIDLNGDRVAQARKLYDEAIRARFTAIGLTYPAERAYLRAFKSERELELWVMNRGQRKYTLLNTYKTYISGKLGPKLQSGDLQVPEGFYTVDRFNPRSRFLLSLGLSYPNATDRARSGDLDPGGDIFIHGGRASIGCLAIGDDHIPEVYLTALDATNKPVRVDIFPMRPTAPAYRSLYDSAPKSWQDLWRSLEVAYSRFARAGSPE